jgi:hypothetical protein
MIVLGLSPISNSKSFFTDLTRLSDHEALLSELGDLQVFKEYHHESNKSVIGILIHWWYPEKNYMYSISNKVTFENEMISFPILVSCVEL